ncbi:MAG: hypothetical protein RL095_1756 [Verrucomicrobiota bacterium]|jgi:hypothetical protein
MKEQVSFTGGEIAPTLYARRDFERYVSSVGKLRNMLVRPHGAAWNRPGTEFVGYAPAAYGVRSGRMIPFIFSDTQAYVLAFTDKGDGTSTLQILKDGGIVLDAVSAPTNFTVSWPIADIEEASFAQDGNTLILCHHLHAPLGITRGAQHYLWTIADLSLTPEVAAPTGLAAARNKIGTTAMNRLRVGYMFESYDFYTSTMGSGNLPLSGIGQTIVGWTVRAGDRILATFQTVTAENGIYIAQAGAWQRASDCPVGTSMAGKQLRTSEGGNMRVGAGTVGTDFTTSPSAPTLTKTFNYSDEFSLVTDTLNTTTDKIYVQVVAESLASLTARVGEAAAKGLVGVCIFKNDLSVSGPTVYNINSDTLITLVIDSTTLTARTGLDTAKGKPQSVSYTYTTTAPAQTTAFKNFDYKIIAIGAKGGYSKPSDPAHMINDLTAAWATNRITWSPVAGAIRYQVFRSDSGDIYKLIGTTETTQFQDANIAGGESILDAIPGSTFTSSGNYPGAVAFHQQRLIFAGTDNEPMTLWFSRSGDRYNFQKHIPIQADDAIKVTIAAGEVNQIRQLISHQALIILTANAEWSLTGAAGVEDAITATSVSIRQQSKNGAALCRPEITGSGLVHVQNGGQAVRNLTWSLEAEAFTGSEVSLLARHLLEESPLVEIAYAKRPDGILWGLRADGKLTAATLLEEQKVNAWSLCDFSIGGATAICSIPEGGKDSLYIMCAVSAGAQFPYLIAYLRMSQRNLPFAELNFLDAAVRHDASSTLLDGASRIAITDIGGGQWTLAVAAQSIFTVGATARMEEVQGYEALSNIGEPLVSLCNGVLLKVLSKAGTDGLSATITVTGTTDGTTTFALPTLAGLPAPCTAYRSGGKVFAPKNSFQRSGTAFSSLSTYAFITDGVDQGNFSGSGSQASASWRFDRAYSGYRYQSLIETLPGDAVRPEGSKSASPQLRIGLEKSAGIEIRPAYSFAQWSSFAPANQSSTPIDAKNLFTGVGTITQASSWEAGSAVQIRQRKPLPFTLLSITQENQNGR